MPDTNYIATAAVFIVKDLARSVAWYTERLDFQAAKLDWNENPAFAIVERDGAAIMLKQGNTPGTANRRLTPGDIIFDAYIWVRDLKKLELALKISDTQVFAGPTRRVYGCTEIMVADPDDYLVCFGHCP